MSSIRYTKGDATRPQAEGNKIIVHICNDRGAYSIKSKLRDNDNVYININRGLLEALRIIHRTLRNR